MAGQGRTSGCSRRSCASAQGQSPLQRELLEMATLETQVPFGIT
jgi:hypothetical protein